MFRFWILDFAFRFHPFWKGILENLMLEIHPFVRQRPDAVFVMRAQLRALDDHPRALEAGRRAAEALFQRASHEGSKRQIVIKPNITTGPELDPQTMHPYPGQDGVVTSPYFVAGFTDGLRVLDDTPILMAEGSSPQNFVARGYHCLLRERDIELVSLDTLRFTADHYPTEGLNWFPVNGVVFKDLPFVRPIGDPDILHINMPKMKAHNLAVTTLSIKNYQGTVPPGFRHFCGGVNNLETLPESIRVHFQPDAYEHVEALFKEHVKAGYTRWDLQGIRDEGYAQRAIDALYGTQPDLHVLEGCTIRDGTGFRRGQDLLGNYVLFGLNPVHVDSIGSWVMGHDPRNIGLYRVGHERGKGENDPARIETFLVEDEAFHPIDYRDLERIPAGVYHHGDDSVLRFF